MASSGKKEAVADDCKSLSTVYKRPKDDTSVRKRPLPTLPSTANRRRFHTKSQSHDQARSVFSSSAHPHRHRLSTPNPIRSTNLKQRARPQSARLSSAINRPRSPAPSRSLPSMPEQRTINTKRSSFTSILPAPHCPSSPNPICSTKHKQRVRPQSARSLHATQSSAKRSAMSSHHDAKPRESHKSKAEAARRASFNTASLIKPSLKKRPRPPKLSLQSPPSGWEPPADVEEKSQKKLIGAGAFGKVYQVRHAYSGDMFAMKEIPLSHNADLGVVDREVQIMRQLTHPNIVQFIDHRRTAHSLCILMEFIHGETIRELYLRRGPFKECVIAKYTAQLLQALDYAHSRKIIHRDIKGGNIMISERGEVKLVDLGAAKLWESGNSTMSPSMNFHNTPLWTAPEMVIPPCAYDAKADVWSVGCVLIEMTTAALPWAERNFKMDLNALFVIGGKGNVPKIPKGLSAKCRDFMQLCLRRDPDKRCSARELTEHAFVKGL